MLYIRHLERQDKILIKYLGETDFLEEIGANRKFYWIFNVLGPKKPLWAATLSRKPIAKAAVVESPQIFSKHQTIKTIFSFLLL